MRINRCESERNINLISEHIPTGYFHHRQLLMKGLCDAIGEFHANKTMKNSENPILRGVLMRRGAYFFVQS